MASRSAVGALASSVVRRAMMNNSSSASLTQARRFAAGGHGPGQTYAGLTLREPPFIYKALGQLAGATMWFWVFYRFYHDGDAFINGHDSHWMHDLIEEEKKKLKA
ncbi:hypothetical protein PPROV_000287800 [Pycnococcus provasolii]|uniref:Uncharacterized protein n=1 Tax=Pycnococcus provasolii TaxID=41880 RepID=A0A830HAJ5_9CHLO|nr:hypothetical protein PPROV_000287800 [Pycnococcus provasolii]